jgi:DNA-binding transcriptional regulator LsrR (DeoR family)
MPGMTWKLDDELRDEIRRVYRQGELTQGALALKYHLSKRTINTVVSGVKPLKRPFVPRVHADMEMANTREDAARLARLIPDEDPRSLTAFLCGDPLPNDPRRQA